MNNTLIAVALSIYKNDHPDYIELSINSVLDQSIESDIFIQVDGYVSDDIKKSLDKYTHLPNITIYYHKSNLGLATRLNQIIDITSKNNNYKYLARMDADDICMPNRFIAQIEFLEKNPDISVVGSDVIEIDKSGNELFYKKMDSNHEILKNKIIKKCPLNHPSVMFRMSTFHDGTRYKYNLMNTQDYYLWIDILAAGKKISNINEPLLKFRINDSFHERRGIKKAINDVKSRIYAFKKLDVITISNIFHVFTLFLLRVSPPSIKKWAYKNLR